MPIQICTDDALYAWIESLSCDVIRDMMAFFFISNRPIFKSQIQTDVKNELLNWICFGCFPCICRVGVLIILTMQSGRKWAKRWWWWQAPTSLPPALLTSPPTHCYSEHLISFFYLYMYTNWKLPFCSVYTSSFKTAVYFETTRQYIQLLKAIAFNTLTHLLVQVTCTWSGTSVHWQCWLCHLGRGCDLTQRDIAASVTHPPTLLLHLLQSQSLLAADSEVATSAC